MKAGDAASGQGAAASSALARLRDRGLDLAAALPPGDWDAIAEGGWRCERLLPGARSVLLVGSGGRSLGRALGGAALAGGAPNPVDDHCRAALDEAAAELPGPGRAWAYTDRLGPDGRPAADGSFVDLVALARAAGLGRPSRLRLLLHADFGPWLSMRGAIASEVEAEAWARVLAAPPLLEDDLASPCEGCPAPCAVACPGHALDDGLLDLARCVETRLAGPPCDTACAARRACVLGREHAYTEAMEAHHARASLAFVRPD